MSHELQLRRPRWHELTGKQKAFVVATLTAAFIAGILLAFSSIQQGLFKKEAFPGIKPSMGAWVSSFNNDAIFIGYLVMYAVLVVPLVTLITRWTQGREAQFQWAKPPNWRQVRWPFIGRTTFGISEWFCGGWAFALQLDANPSIGGNPGLISALVLLAPAYIGGYTLVKGWREIRLNGRISRISVVVLSLSGIFVSSADSSSAGGNTISWSVGLALAAGIFGALKVGAMRTLKARGLSLSLEVLMYAAISIVVFTGLVVVGVHWFGFQPPALSTILHNEHLRWAVVTASASKALAEFANRSHGDPHQITTVQLVNVPASLVISLFMVPGYHPTRLSIVAMVLILAASSLAVWLLPSSGQGQATAVKRSTA